MSQDQPSRLDRIESMMESQMERNAEFATRLEVPSQEIRDLKEANQIALERDREQSANIQLIAESVQLLVNGLRQHASDGHGA